MKIKRFLAEYYTEYSVIGLSRPQKQILVVLVCLCVVCVTALSMTFDLPRKHPFILAGMSLGSGLLFSLTSAFFRRKEIMESWRRRKQS